LPVLAQLFLEDVNAQVEKQVHSLAPESLDMLSAYAWPGNLDELHAVIAEAHSRSTGIQITPRDLPETIRRSQEAAARVRRAEDSIDLEEFLVRVERELIERALSRAKGNKARAAKLLGMTRPKLYRRLVQLKLIE
jgi:transcriptional regulator with PAS, ATPase and Fis domain